MKNNTIMAMVAINLVILVLLSFFVPHLMISPGKTIDAHVEFATDCFACHTPFLGSSPAKCISCHNITEIGLKTSKGVAIAKEKKNVVFHQKLIEEDCIACHSDHNGVQAFKPISEFSHQLLETNLQQQCDSCHLNPKDTLHQSLKTNCSQCHTQETWLPATFAHDKYFRFDRHHSTQCATCHMDNDYTQYTCYGCHEHSRSEIREEHVEEGIYDYEICTECHRSGDEDEAERIWDRKRYEQRKSDSFNRKGYKKRRNKHHDDDDD